MAKKNCGCNSSNTTTTQTSNQPSQPNAATPSNPALDYVSKCTPWFNMNNVSTAVDVYKAINTAANEITGLDVMIYRAIPDGESTNVIFQEYTLYNVAECPVCIKAVSESGRFTDAKLDYAAFGINYDLPTEIQFDKTLWERHFGIKTSPQKGDVVYIPINNKIYQIDSSTKIRGFMEQETGYKAALVKYTPSTTRRESQSLSEMMDVSTVSVAELYGVDISEMVEDVTNYRQNDPKSNTKIDEYKTLDFEVKTNDEKIQMGCIIVAKSSYNFKDVTCDKAIIYNHKDSMSIGDERSLSVWVRNNNTVKNTSAAKINTPIKKFGNFFTFGVGVDISAIYKKGDHMLLHHTDDISFLCEYQGKNSKGEHKISIEREVLSYVDAIATDWGSKSFTIIPVHKSPIISNDEISISIINNKYLEILHPTHKLTEWFDTPLEFNVWYGLVINLDNTTNKVNYSMYCHTLPYNKKSKPLTCINKGETFLSSPFDYNNQQFHIKRTSLDLANIRVYDTCLNEETAVNDLLTNTIPYSSHSIVLDSADVILKSPYYAKQI